MNNNPNTQLGAPVERGPRQPHRLDWLEAGPDRAHISIHYQICSLEQLRTRAQRNDHCRISSLNRYNYSTTAWNLQVGWLYF